ncbi:TonB-dependent receptor [Aerophototrophica crusticola]|uniref:TonB-dependent receptor n=1 Tax=Aerophototrophica crusticola TaxID=1709002 RepID=A0A858R3T9_9PROT|nr:TonB-dependent receptor [Rhodospirillaceae bacterium B3]
MSTVKLAAVAAVMGGLFTAGAALAQAPAELEAPEGGHGRTTLEEVVVTASPLRSTRLDVLQGTSVLAGEALDRALSANIGETLSRLPGISQTGFGQGASRPVIRGLGGDRIRVLVGGIGSIDASTTSPDHAPAIDLATAKRVEVVRGPATLLYGSNAVGGVVNVLDGRIPVEAPANGAAGFVRLGYGSNADERFAAGSVDVAAAPNLVLHVDAFNRQTDDYEAPGFVRSRALRLAEPPEPGEEEPRGRVENSDLEQFGATGGLSVVGDWGFFGFSASRYLTDYGIPGGGHGHEEEEGHDHEEGEEHGHEGVRIDLEQTRVDLMGEVNREFLAFQQAKIRLGWADYEHKELEGEEVGTRFLNDGWEGRLELVQKPVGALTGAVGVQVLQRDFEASGEEAFVPPAKTWQYGAFTVQRLDFGPWSAEAGLRVERQTVKAGDLGFDRDFTPVSVSAGLAYSFGQGWLAGLSLARTERAPNAEELLSDGPHAATGTYEVGDPTLGKERGLGGELTLKKAGGPVTGAANLFYTDYKGFIFEDFTGEEEDGLPVAAFRGADARFWGFELEASVEAWRRDDLGLRLDGAVDYVKATNKDTDQPLPRIPPLSFRVGAELESAAWAVRAEVEWADRQDRAAAFETETKGYTVLNAGIDWHPFPERDITLFLEGRNLTDEEVRLSTSFLKDRLPQPGRDIRLSVKAGF